MRGFLENPDTIALYTFLAPFMVWRFPKLGRGGRWMAILIALAYLAEVILSGTRIAMLVVLVVLALYAVVFVPRARLAFGLATVGVLGATTLVTLTAVFSAETAGVPRVLRPSTLSTLSGRTEAWSAAEKLVSHRPVAGYGVGTEGLVLADYRATADRVYQTCLDRFVVSAPRDDPAFAFLCASVVIFFRLPGSSIKR